MNIRIMARAPAATSVLAVAVPAFADTELKICVPASTGRPCSIARVRRRQNSSQASGRSDHRYGEPSHPVAACSGRLLCADAANVAALIALVLYPFAPWEGGAAHFVNMIGNTMGPIFGVMMVDYYLIRKGRVNVEALYREDGRVPLRERLARVHKRSSCRAVKHAVRY